MDTVSIPLKPVKKPFHLILDEHDYKVIKEASDKSGKPMTKIIRDGAITEARVTIRREKIGINGGYSNQ